MCELVLVWVTTTGGRHPDLLLRAMAWGREGARAIEQARLHGTGHGRGSGERDRREQKCVECEVDVQSAVTRQQSRGAGEKVNIVAQTFGGEVRHDNKSTAASRKICSEGSGSTSKGKKSGRVGHGW